MSCTSLKCVSNFLHALSNSLYNFGISFRSFKIAFPVLIPATTSSPCAFMRYSPDSSLVPSVSFLVNTTPVALSFPMFPNTIV